MEQIEFRIFKRSDFSVYQTWFSDPWLEAALGPMDQEWLEHILLDETGAQYAIFQANEMVAVLGVVWANDDAIYHTVTDLAIRPDRRRQGLGQKVLHHLLHQVKVPKAKGWITYVEPNNTKAIDFMKKCAWDLVEETFMYAFIRAF